MFEREEAREKKIRFILLSIIALMLIVGIIVIVYLLKKESANEGSVPPESETISTEYVSTENVSAENETTELPQDTELSNSTEIIDDNADDTKSTDADVEGTESADPGMEGTESVDPDVDGTESAGEGRKDSQTGENVTSLVPESEPVERDYFDDAVFIGDSRTDGMIINTGLTNAVSYTHKGLTVDTVFTSEVINKNGAKVSVMDALKKTDFNKVYVMFGVNETGWIYNDIFIEKYGKVIDEIKAINPNAIIYVQEIPPVSKEVSATHSYIKNKKINEYNELIRQMTEEKGVYYIDVATAVKASDGTLPADAAIDGIHLKKDYCIKWLDYLQSHTISK